MDPDFVFIVNYACPRCHAALEARASGPPSWLRCPSCGRASLPPEHNRAPRSVTFLDDDSVIIGSFTTGGASTALPIRPRGMAALPPPALPKTPMVPILLGSGFFLTMLLCLFSLLESNGARAGFFGLAAVACLILLARQNRRSPED